MREQLRDDAFASATEGVYVHEMSKACSVVRVVTSAPGTVGRECGGEGSSRKVLTGGRGPLPCRGGLCSKSQLRSLQQEVLGGGPGDARLPLGTARAAGLPPGLELPSLVSARVLRGSVAVDPRPESIAWLGDPDLSVTPAP